MVKKSLKRLVPFLICLIFVFMFLFPFLFTVSTSLKQPSDVISTQPRFFPNPISIQNYKDMFEYLTFGKYLANSLIAALVSTVISLTVLQLRQGFIDDTERKIQLFCQSSLGAFVVLMAFDIHKGFKLI